MATGTEMLISTLVKALKLEPEVDKIRAAIDAGMVEKFQNAIAAVQTFDERLAAMAEQLDRIERRLTAGACSIDSGPANEPIGFIAAQPDDRGDNAGH